jgi:hypothetical protein
MARGKRRERHWALGARDCLTGNVERGMGNEKMEAGARSPEAVNLKIPYSCRSDMFRMLFTELSDEGKKSGSSIKKYGTYQTYK